MRAAVPCLFLVVLVSLSAAAAGAQTAREERQARRLFEQGVAAANDGDFAAALARFTESYGLNPRPSVLFNIAACHEELGSPREAIEAYESYLAVGGDELPPERREAALGRIADLQRRLTFLEIAVSESGASVLVAGRAVGITPLAAPVQVPPGMVEVRVRLEGFDPIVTQVTVPAGRTTSIALTLTAVPVAAPPPILEQPEGPGEEEGEAVAWWEEWWFWTAVGAAVGIVVIGASSVAWPEDEPAAGPPPVWTLWGR
jgi:hypothetical protein